MDCLERGLATISSTYPLASNSPPVEASNEGVEEEEEEEEEEKLVSCNNNTKSINNIIWEFGSGRAPRHPQLQQLSPSITPSTAPPRKRVSYEAFQAKAPTVAAATTTEVAKVKEEEEEEEMEMAHRRHRPSKFGGANAELSAVLRDFSEGIM
jgi:hypothetical protein